MKMIRVVLGKLILALDAWFVPALIVKRSSVEQAQVDAETSIWVLYQLVTCPFCVKVRREMKRLGLKISMKDVAADAAAHAELMRGGKIDQFPCLRMGEVWMYESSDVVMFLRNKFGPTVALEIVGLNSESEVNA